jgi:hypothetical protein
MAWTGLNELEHEHELLSQLEHELEQLELLKLLELEFVQQIELT